MTDSSDSSARHHGSRARRRAWIVTGASVLGYAVILTYLSERADDYPDTDNSVRNALVACSMLAGAVYLVGMWVNRKRAALTTVGVWAIVITGAAARVVVLCSPPFLEDDYHRYLLDGALSAHGLSPYQYTPLSLLQQSLVKQSSALHDGTPLSSPLVKRGKRGVGRYAKTESAQTLDGESTVEDRRLAALGRDGREMIANINHPHLSTVYPPVAQAVFAAAYFVKPWSVSALRAVLLVFDAATLLLMLSLLRELRLPIGWLAWYWWNPILLREITSSAHMDVIAFPVVLAAVLCAIRSRSTRAAVLLIVGAGVKVWPVLLLPVVLRPLVARPKRLALALLAALAVGALLLWPMLGAAFRDDGGLMAYTRYWHNNEGFFAVLSWVGERVLPAVSYGPDEIAGATRDVAVWLVAGWALLHALKPVGGPADLVRRSVSIAAAAFLLSPTQFPWYFLWVLPLLSLSPRFSLLLYSGLLPLYYLNYDHRAVLWVEHLPVWVMLVGEWVAGRRSPRSVLEQDPG